MNGAKPFASLSPGLLARKGAARPAMRTQLQPMRQFHESAAREMDDLGWNDMGHDHDPAIPPATPDLAPEPAAPEPPVAHVAEVVPLKAAAQNETAAEPSAVVPEVVRQQEDLATRVGKAGRRSALSEGRRAAFTLRLDRERHLKLRLACTVSNRSAQQIVTEALDRLIAEQPDVAALVEQIRTSR